MLMGMCPPLASARSRLTFVSGKPWIRLHEASRSCSLQIRWAAIGGVSMIRLAAFVLSIAVGSALGAAMGNLALGIAVSFAVATGSALAANKGADTSKAEQRTSSR